jgi:integrase
MNMLTSPAAATKTGTKASNTNGIAPPLTALAVAGRKAVRACKRTGKAGLPAIPGVIDTWVDLTPSRRRDLRTAVTMLGRAAGKDLAAIPFTAQEVRAILGATTPAACGLSDATFKAYRGWIAHVLKRLGLMQERRSAGDLLPAWASLVSSMTDDKAWIRLRAFVRHCSALGVAPSEVEDATLAAYLEHLRQGDIRGTARDTVRRVARTWNKAIETIPGWPAQGLSPPVSEPRQYSLPFGSYPPSLQADVEAFRLRLTLMDGDKLYPEDEDQDLGPSVPLRPASVRTRTNAVRLLLAAAVQTGMAAEAITSLSVLVQRDRAKAILDWHWRRAGKRTTDHTGVLSDTLRVLAKHHVRLPPEDLARLLPVLKKAKPPKRSTMTSKNATVLRELEDPVRRAKILHLPAHLMRLAHRTRAGWVDARGGEHVPPRHEAARLAALAVAIEIELHAPMRIENLAALRLGQHLKKLDVRGTDYTHIAVQAEETKTGVPFEWPLEKDTAALLADYVSRFRPILPNASGTCLFPSKVRTDRPRSKNGLGKAITTAIHKHVGVRMTTHQFRAFAGALLIEDNPHAIEDLRLILGHSTLATALAYYKAWAPKDAAARFGRLISSKRRQTRLVAEAAYGGSPRRGRPSSRGRGA